MRVLLVDDHQPIRERLRELFQLRPDLEVVGEASNGAEAVQRVEELAPDLVLMDMNMPVMNGAEATRRIREKHPEIKVLALTAFADMSLVSAMVQAGASGYLIKGGSPQELLQSVDAVARGRGALDREVTGEVLEDLATLYKREQERANALAELDRMKSEFVSVVSHELRTPLTTIKGGVETLRSKWDAMDESVKLEFLSVISRQCERLTRMIAQILTVSGIQAGGLNVTRSVFPLHHTVREALVALGDKITQRAVRLELSADVEASGDRDRIREIASALIENALNFTTGEVVISVLADGGIPKVHIRDQGPGIDEKTLHRLLHEPFTQVDSSDTREVGGLGLSLYIARRVLEASGGRLEAESDPERGSTFTMVLAAP